MKQIGCSSFEFNTTPEHAPQMERNHSYCSGTTPTTNPIKFTIEAIGRSLRTTLRKMSTFKVEKVKLG
jgi:hypothetical protein